MIGTFPGKLALAEGEEVDVDLEIAGGKLRLTTGVSEIGSWPTEMCAITPVGDGYRLTLEGEHVAFHPDHPEAFAAVVRGMDPGSKSRGAPVPITDPEPEASSGYDLEAALDQVLGGTEEDHHAAVLDDSPDDIAVTLEALFATAYPEFDDDEEDDDSEPVFAAPASPQPDPVEPVFGIEPETDDVGTAAEADEEDVPEPIEFVLPEVETETPTPAVADEPVIAASIEPEDSDPVFETVESDELPEPVVSETSWAPQPVDDVPDIEEDDEDSLISAVGAFDLEAALEDAGVDLPEPEIEDTDPAPRFERVSGLTSQPTFTPADELEASDEDDDQLESFDIDDDDDDSYEADEPATPGFGGGFGSFRPSAPAAYDDGDVYHDSPYGADTGPSSYRLGSAPYSQPEEHRPAASYGYDEPTHRQDRPAASFDLDGAVDGAGYTPPPLGADDDHHPSSDSGMFSRSASERFASVSGAIRSRLASDDSDDDYQDGAEDGMSIADQIVARQEESEKEHRGKRFTPDLVKKLAIGAVALFVVAGLVLVTPVLIRLVVDQIETPAAIETTATTVAEEAAAEVTTTTQVPEVVTPEEEADALPPLLSDSVFSLTAAEFAERWDTVVDNATLSVGDAYLERNAVGFTQYLGLQWETGGNGHVRSYQIILDPGGDSRDDELGIAALALAIDVSHPEYEGADLVEVLAALGLDVNNPSLELDGSIVRDGVRYDLVYNDQELVVLDVMPASANPTTTTTEP